MNDGLPLLTTSSRFVYRHPSSSRLSCPLIVLANLRVVFQSLGVTGCDVSKIMYGKYKSGCKIKRRLTKYRSDWGWCDTTHHIYLNTPESKNQ